MPKKTKKPFVQADDFAKLKMPKSIALSPDGSKAAYMLSWIDTNKNKYFANLHVVDTKTGATMQWTQCDNSNRAPVWSSDGSQLVFLRHEKGEDRIYRMRPGGGAPELVFKKRGSFASVKWAQDDTCLVVKFRNANPDPDAEKALEQGEEPKCEAPAVRKVTRLAYRADGAGFLPEDRYHLYKLDLKTMEFVQLTKGKTDDGSFAISPDGNTVAFLANRHPDPDPNMYDNDIFLLNLKTRKERKLKGPQGEKDALSFSPNGKYLVYLGHHNKQDAWGVEEFHPWRIDLQTGKIKNLTPQFDRQAMDLSIADIGFDFESPKVCWSKDSRAIYYQVSDEGSTVIARARMTAGDPEYVFDLPGQAALFDMAGNTMAVVHAGFKNLGDIFFCADVTAKKPAFTKLITHNEVYLKSREFGKTKEVHFRGHDGTRLHGWLVTPPSFNPNKKYPAILEVHGGPRAQYARVFFHEMQYLAAQGFVVFFTNPRGSQGYGRAFAEAIVNAWGTKDFEDVMAAADWMETQKFIDKKRIGITGGSYGGYMTNFAMGNTRRFKAGVTQRSVVNLATFAGTSDIGYFDHYEFGGFYWQNPAGYAKMSPLTYADKIRDPLLIIHSENDMRCPIEQAEQLYAALKIRKRKVEFLRFPEESHGLSRGGRPDRRVIRLNAIVEWFKKYL